MKTSHMILGCANEGSRISFACVLATVATVDCCNYHTLSCSPILDASVHPLYAAVLLYRTCYSWKSFSFSFFRRRSRTCLYITFSMVRHSHLHWRSLSPQATTGAQTASIYLSGSDFSRLIPWIGPQLVSFGGCRSRIQRNRTKVSIRRGDEAAYEVLLANLLQLISRMKYLAMDALGGCRSNP
jgi:hypothetical protein